MRLDLIRIEESRHGTLGILLLENLFLCMTLEPPWRNNEPFKSCIPTGVYACEKIESPKYGSTLHVTNVPNRTDILFHKGNSITDTSGCVLVGETCKFNVNGQRVLVDSSTSFKLFSKIIIAGPVVLIVRDFQKIKNLDFLA